MDERLTYGGQNKRLAGGEKGNDWPVCCVGWKVVRRWRMRRVWAAIGREKKRKGNEVAKNGSRGKTRAPIVG